LGECGKNFQKKDGQLIELVSMNMRTPFDVFCSMFWKNWQAHKEDGKEYTFDTFYGLLINDRIKLLDEGNLGGNRQAHLLKGKGKINYKEIRCSNAHVHRMECLD
jgi:hypothetical protein